MKIFATILAKFVWNGLKAECATLIWHLKFPVIKNKQNNNLKIILLDRLLEYVHLYMCRLPSKIILFTENLQKH